MGNGGTSGSGIGAPNSAAGAREGWSYATFGRSKDQRTRVHMNIAAAAQSGALEMMRVALGQYEADIMELPSRSSIYAGTMGASKKAEAAQWVDDVQSA